MRLCPIRLGGVAPVVLVSITALALAGCGVTAADLPLPGGGIGGDTYELNAVFSDALNLPDKAHVKLEGVRIGTVTDISAKDFTAKVTMVIRQDVPLPVGTMAELRQATPLGDVFVALQPPKAGSGSAALRPGDTIPITATSAAASVEDTLAALSALVNGGGLGELKTIVTEVNAALDGRGPQTAHLINQLTTTLTTLNERTDEIDRILKSALALTTTARERRGTIDAAFTELTPAIKVLSDQTGRFTEVLTKVAKAGDLGNEVLVQTGGEIKALLRDLAPVLDGFASLDETLGPTLSSMVALADILAGATKGESGAGSGSLAGLTNIPGLGGDLPNLGDFTAGYQSITDNLMELVKRLGAPR